ncbi:MAG: hypothetical protein OES57_10250 [Acidimicrobiia bacterium]|nr:hypothetical protein [Acidimicrobiia bacterium]
MASLPLSAWRPWAAAAQAGRTRPLPWQRRIYTTVTAVYLARGIAVLPQLGLRALGVDVGPTREIVFSAVALGLGILHVAGLGRSDGDDPHRHRPALAS